MKSEVTKFLEENNIKYKLHTHKAVFTVAEAEEHCSEIPGIPCKNLFLKDTDNYYLVILRADKTINIKEFGILVNSKKISFASVDALNSLLRLTKGSVSPLGLINDAKNIVKLFIDKSVWEADIVSFHPNTNTESIEISKEMFHKMISKIGNTYVVQDF